MFSLNCKLHCASIRVTVFDEKTFIDLFFLEFSDVSIGKMKNDHVCFSERGANIFKDNHFCLLSF